MDATLTLLRRIVRRERIMQAHRSHYYQRAARRLGSQALPVSGEEADRLAAYLNLLARWNRVHNLTGIRDPEALIDRHLAESLALRPLVSGDSVADIGSGAGLPGIPLAIALPHIRFTLIESRRKRVSFLRHVATALALANVAVEHARAEDVTAGPFATVVARAVAAPADLIAIAEPLIAPGGRLVVLTGDAKSREIVAAATRLRESRIPVGVQIQSRIIVLERL